MGESYVNVTEGSGKKLHSWQRTIGANNVEGQVVLAGVPHFASYVSAVQSSTATANSHLVQIMAGASLIKLRGGEVASEYYTSADKDYTTLVQKVGGMKPEVILISGYYPQAGPMINTDAEAQQPATSQVKPSPQREVPKEKKEKPVSLEEIEKGFASLLASLRQKMPGAAVTIRNGRLELSDGDGPIVALRELEADHEFLLRGDVFDAGQIEEWIRVKSDEYFNVRNRPHPYEMSLYFDA